jgi:hypothetical protein
MNTSNPNALHNHAIAAEAARYRSPGTVVDFTRSSF